eukprot:SAG22_NODE_2454_length_2554_cov_2.075356_2_plen_255_part_00
MIEIKLEPVVLRETRSTVNAVRITLPRLAAIEGEAVFNIKLTALTASGTNSINPVSVALATAELVLVPYCCVSGAPTSNGVWDVKARVLAADGFATNPLVNASLEHTWVDLPFSSLEGDEETGLGALYRTVTARMPLAGAIPTQINDDKFPIKSPTVSLVNVTGQQQWTRERAEGSKENPLAQCLDSLALTEDEVLSLQALLYDHAASDDDSSNGGGSEHPLERLCRKASNEWVDGRGRRNGRALTAVIRKRFL